MILYLALAAVLWSPIPLGSNRPRYWYILECLVFVTFALFCLSRVFAGRGERFPYSVWLIALPLAWALFLVMQLVPLPQAVLELLSPTAMMIYELESPTREYLSISLQKFSTFNELLKRLMYVSVFLIIVFLLKTRTQLKSAVYLLLALGLFQCMFAFLGYMSDPTDHLRGTYTNKNHFALYVAICLSLSVGHFLSNQDYREQEGYRFWLNGHSLVSLALFLVFVTILLYSQSKGAVLGFVSGIVFTFFFLREPGERKSDRRRISVMFTIAGVTLVASLWFGARDIYNRFTLDKILYDERWIQWADSMRLAMDYFWVGSGAGTYKYVFPGYKSQVYRPLFYDHVHNDYLQFMCNEGIIGLLIFVMVLVFWLFAMRKGFRGRRDPYLKGMVFGIVLSVVTISVHAFVDYNLQIPANTLTLFALMGLGLAAIRIDRRRSSLG